MVRIFPIYRPHAPSGWQPYGFQTSVRAQTGDSDVYNGAPLICRPTPHTDSPFGIFYGENPLNDFFPLFLLEMSFVIVVTRLLRLLLRPLRQPRIVCEILGGIIIGPSILGRSKKFREFVFPENADFLVKNIGIMGFMYFLFISGVKMDIALVTRSGKKQLSIAIMGVLLPFITANIVALIMRKSMDKELAKISSLGAVTSSIAITAFPVLYPILKELNLLSSEVGRMALSTALISDAIGINTVAAFEAAKQGEANSINALWYMISVILLVGFMVTYIRKFMAWIIAKTPEGQSVDQAYVVFIFMSVLIIGFITDTLGIAILNGPLWLGLVIPDGPPLGAALVERSEAFVMDILMPASFAFVGLYTDFSSMSSVKWSTLQPLFAMVATGYVVKFVATLLGCLFFQFPLRDGVTLSLIMSLRGQVELILFIHWMDKKIIEQPSFTLMVLLTVTTTAIVTPLISIVYDPTRPYMVNKRRTIQHTAQSTELRILVCIHDQESVSAAIDLLEATNPNLSSPFSIYALRLVELVGRAAPLFIDHEKQPEPSRYADSDTIHNALKRYEEIRRGFVKIHAFTAVAPKRTMYQDICELALLNKATFIILPFNKERIEKIGGTELVRVGVRSVNSNVLAHAPCSVGVLVDKGHLRNPLMAYSYRHSIERFAVLFLGGADSREALAYADRMAGNMDVSVTVIRFLSHNGEGDKELEKKLDDGVVTSFWVKNEVNERVVYREITVRNGAETVAAIQAINDESYDLWIVGRKEGINPFLLEGLEDWSENHELGVIGDYVASDDFGGNASVLVVQQQILREQKANTLCASFFK
ncbi:hypothetical protein FEM48_Zijuj02G0110200 [Ziziphus jujuba var. spinosa]|uniref:Cation/H(+) antiporter 24 n=1 Tax=Ziziphus jujuba var. spinosa TaxID=714518 RepID=A0A978VVC5_ZIZJJ|nr:hypothetical protein FEM48_Zijuj02G0110200 [Ziziphus jujuba var. spinosa]